MNATIQVPELERLTTRQRRALARMTDEALQNTVFSLEYDLQRRGWISDKAADLLAAATMIIEARHAE